MLQPISDGASVYATPTLCCDPCRLNSSPEECEGLKDLNPQSDFSALLRQKVFWGEGSNTEHDIIRLGFYYFLKNPERINNNNPYIALIRRIILYSLVVLQQLLGLGSREGYGLHEAFLLALSAVWVVRSSPKAPVACPPTESILESLKAPLESEFSRESSRIKCPPRGESRRVCRERPHPHTFPQRIPPSGLGFSV